MRFSDQRISVSRGKRWPCLVAAAIFVAGIASATRADDLGVIGPVYPIAEKDLLASIETKLRAKERSGELAAIQAQAKKRAIKTIEEPQPVADLGKAQKARTYYYDPSVIVPYPITDDAGRVLVAAGTRVNPLDTVTLSRRLLFFDARDPQQVRTAKALIDGEGGRVKPIVTGRLVHEPHAPLEARGLLRSRGSSRAQAWHPRGARTRVPGRKKATHR